jgi:hypothetical protein
MKMSDVSGAKRKRGRPAVPAEKAKREAVGIRTTKELKGQIKAHADLAGRSVAQEIELRLERSFAPSTFPPEVETLAELLARAMHQTGEIICTGGMLTDAAPVDWWDNAYAFDQAAKAALFILRQSRPEGARQPVGLFAALKGYSALPPNLAHAAGRAIAEGVLAAIRGEQPGVQLGRWARSHGILERLGSIGARLSRRG